jgi:thioredoxin-like negative regulator of GroEL
VRESLASARAAFANEDYVAARSAALDVLASDADSPEALLIAGGAAAGLGDVPEAIACIDRLPRGRDRRINDARALAANLTLLKQYRASDAERRFREVLADDPRHLASVSGLASLLGLAGRRHEAIPLYLELIRQGQITTDQLSLLGAESGASRNAALHNQCLESVPDDPIPLLGLTWESAHKNNYAETERLARRALKSAPDLIEAHALLGRALAAQHRFEKVPEWQANLPPEADENPEVWRIRGDYAREALGERRAAARC